MTDRPDPNDTSAMTPTPGPTNPGNQGNLGEGSATGTPGGSAAPGGSGSFGSDTAATEGRGEGLAGTVRRSASDAADAARGVAAEQTERARSAVADEVSSVAHALRTAADDLREGSAQERTFAQIADTLADTAEAIRGKDLGEMVREVTEMARRHPLTFLGGAALVGFTAVRFAKASHDDVWRRRPGRPVQRAGMSSPMSDPATGEFARTRNIP